MLLWHIARQHWVFFGIAVGLAIMLIFVLSYIVMWSSRKLEEENATVEINSIGNFAVWFQTAFPWVLILTIAGSIAVTVGYGILKWLDPPNW
jgi:hypothetical protein